VAVTSGRINFVPRIVQDRLRAAVVVFSRSEELRGVGHALLWLNHRELNGMLTKTLGQTAGRALAATAVMSLAVWGVSWLVDGRFLFLGAGAVVGFIVYLAFNMLLGGQEIPNLIRLIKRSSSPSS
ncbi:MAG: hypothetical protein ACE5FD_18145, partial [Anaerolineae bacterium]